MTDANGVRGSLDGTRRNVLRTLGTGAALVATSGVAGARGGLYDAHDDTSDATVDPQFGFPAASADVDPPVEPDHEIQVLIRPREGEPIPEFFFEPTGLFVEPGETVKWNFVTGHHTVSAYHPGFGYQQRVPDGVPAFSAPVMPQGGYWLYTFEAEGVYDYYCGPHEIFGHAGRIVCGSADGFEPLPDLCAGAPPSDGEDGSSDDENSEGGSDGEENGETNGGDDENGESGSGGDGGDDENGDGGGEPELRIPEFTAYTVLTDDALAPERIVREGTQSWDSLDAASKQLFVRIEGFPPCNDDE
jgi:plastocyanin